MIATENKPFVGLDREDGEDEEEDDTDEETDAVLLLVEDGAAAPSSKPAYRSGPEPNDIARGR